MKYLLFFLSFLSIRNSYSQIVSIDYSCDSIIVFVTYEELIKKIPLNDDQKHTIHYLDSMQKKFPDTIKLESNSFWYYNLQTRNEELFWIKREMEDLIKDKKVSFFNKINKTHVSKYRKKKKGKIGDFIYWSFYDPKTDSEFYTILIRTWHEF